jgi:hypothetical protein
MTRRFIPRSARLAATALALAGALSLAGTGTGAAQSGHARTSSFNTPSGNIGCIAFGHNLRCDIAQKDWAAPRAQRPCHLVRGDSLEMTGTGRPIWTCHGDTALAPRGSRRALAYGSRWHWGPFTCASRVTGLTCTNRRGHGFFLSRQSYRVF